MTSSGLCPHPPAAHVLSGQGVFYCKTFVLQSETGDLRKRFGLLQ